MIYIHLRVKFRAMGITFATVDKEFSVGIGVPVPHMPKSVLFDERGIFLAVRS